MRRTRSTSCPTSPSSPARSSCTPTRELHRQVPRRRRPVRAQRLQRVEPEGGPAVGGRSHAGRSIANVSRSAEVPSFGENSFASAVRPSTPSCRRRPPMRSARAAGARTTPGTLPPIAPRSSNELQCTHRSRVGNLRRSSNADKTIHQGVEIGFGAAVAQVDVRARRQSRPALAQPRLHLQRLPLRRRCRFRRQRAARRAAALPARRAALQASERRVLRPQCRMGAAGLLRRQRQHAEDRALRALGPEGSATIRAVGRSRPTSRRATWPTRHYIASTGITNVANRGSHHLFEPGTGRAVYAGIKYRW